MAIVGLMICLVRTFCALDAGPTPDEGDRQADGGTQTAHLDGRTVPGGEGSGQDRAGETAGGERPQQAQRGREPSR
jgi:hypothetical protein